MASGLLLQVTEQFCLLCSIKCCKIPRALLLEEISVWVLRRGWEPRVHFERSQGKRDSTQLWGQMAILPHTPASLHPFRTEWSRKGISPQLQAAGKKLTSGRVAAGGKMGGGTHALTNNSQETFQPCRAGLVTMAHWRGTPECYEASRWLCKLVLKEPLVVSIWTQGKPWRWENRRTEG